MSGPAVPLFGYQRKWFLDRSRFKIGKFARQTGKTFTTTLEVVDDCFEHAVDGRRARWVILSRGERQAREAMNEGIKLHAQAYKMGFEMQEYDWQGAEGSYRALEVDLPHGSKITALPANPDTARGFSANVFLDEFAFHKDSAAIWKALFPVISNGWKLRVTSTPNGKSGKFYELDTAEDSTWSRHVVDIYQAVRDGLPRDIDELREGIADEDAWAQEYELKYLDEASAWLSYDLITSVEDPEAGDPGGYQGGPCYVGRDIGRRNDLHVIFVWEEIGDVLWCREIIEQKRATFGDMDAAFDDVMMRYRVARACIDQTGMGEKVVEDAERRYGSRIEGVLFTGSSKLIMATAGKDGLRIAPSGSRKATSRFALICISSARSRLPPVPRGLWPSEMTITLTAPGRRSSASTPQAHRRWNTATPARRSPRPGSTLPTPTAMMARLTGSAPCADREVFFDGSAS